MIEKRLFLAISLSLMVVWLWSAGTQAQKGAPPALRNMQHFENKENTGYIFEEKNVKNKISDLVEKTDILKSGKLNIEFSNIGGTIKSITIAEYNAKLPISGLSNILGYEDAQFILENISENKLVYTYESPDFKIRKTYSIIKNDYIVNSDIEFLNKASAQKHINFGINVYTINTNSLDDYGNEKSLNEYLINLDGKVYRKAGAFKFSKKDKREISGKIFWAGFRDRYYCALIKPKYETTGYLVDTTSISNLSIIAKTKNVVLSENENVHFKSTFFVGPEINDLLKKYDMEFEKVKRYYNFGLFDVIAKIIEGLMHNIYKFIPNWGICIIIISVIIYFSMYPLTIRGMDSMKKMQALQPLIMSVKEKHKDNPQKMNKEMMELYKEHKINPFGGCLPMFLQMPVFIGLYQVLWRSVSFKGASFLWIKDLSQPDRLFVFHNKIPIIGNEINLLPIIMIIVMFFQQKLSSKNNVALDPSQVAQQKMMTTIMPIFLGFIFYKFASGLTLYFTMFYIFSMLTQWKMSKIKKTA
jgi:YidC/Oxa1 family membrane protein insertase